MLHAESLTGLQRFAGRTLGVATMHGKEQVIGPALMARLPLAGFTAIPDLDTDRFGAFSGEVARGTDPRTACEHKARHGARAVGMDLVIASEGSFGPYPPSPFITCDEEWLVLVDLRDDRTWVHRHVSLETVFGGEECRTLDAVLAFAARMKFPDHGLVLKTREHWLPGDRVFKGIRDAGHLREVAGRMIAEQGSVWAETDLRAMANPTRMRVIGETAARFATELAMTCPRCGTIHFAVAQALWGLPCAQCGFPTQGTRAYLRECRECGHRTEEARADGRTVEDPQYCELCNP
ncbi:MAG: hypothetical protein JNM31_13840 [Flavobacteriales bacterium]|nr:hypothetical protein [Flavobacteriales bacterium]